MSQFKDFRSVSEQEQNSSLVKKGLEEVSQIRKASLELCSALNSLWLCQDHLEHSANLRLGLDLSNSTSIPASKIHFDLMVTSWAIDSCDRLKKPVELFIESSLELIPGEENQDNTVALQSREPLPRTNLCTDSSDLCKHFHKKPDAGTSSTCLGFLSGFVVYRNPPKNNNFSAVISMARLFSPGYRNHKMNNLDKWKLVGALSRAVLQYHSTPWLRETWMDEDIMFFEKEPTKGPGSLEYPHLHLVRRTNDDTSRTVSEMYEDRLIKNKTLFQLGTILLELEFEDSLEAIIEKWNTAFPNAQDTMGSLTDRLLVPKRHAGENLGVEYGRIVRMCLDCDFGLGLSEYSLHNKALQKAFYLQTVYQLEKMLPIWENIYGASSS